MYRIAVVGEKDCIYGFAALGLETFPVKTAKEAKLVVNKLLKEKIAILYLTESIISEIYDELMKFASESVTSVVSIPDLFGSSNFGLNKLRETVIKATGMDILFS